MKVNPESLAGVSSRHPWRTLGAWLVLLLSMGVDFAIFSRESAEAERSVTTLGVWLATLSTLFSFGLLALSSAFAVAAFGATMLVGITLAFLFSPLAGR